MIVTVLLLPFPLYIHYHRSSLHAGGCTFMTLIEGIHGPTKCLIWTVKGLAWSWSCDEMNFNPSHWKSKIFPHEQEQASLGCSANHSRNIFLLLNWRNCWGVLLVSSISQQVSVSPCPHTILSSSGTLPESLFRLTSAHYTLLRQVIRSI